MIEAIAKISKNASRAVLVVDGPKLVGVISEGDIMRAFLSGSNVHSPLIDHVNHSFKYLTRADDQECLKLIQNFGVTLIPVVDSKFNIVQVIPMSEILKKASISG